MSRTKERIVIQTEIALLKAKLSEDRARIECELNLTLDQLNPFKRLEKKLENTFDSVLSKIGAILKH
jgi:hypothetical protein